MSNQINDPRALARSIATFRGFEYYCIHKAALKPNEQHLETNDPEIVLIKVKLSIIREIAESNLISLN